MINMNNVPKDILCVTKLLTSIFSHTMHWSHKSQARYILKQWKTQEMLQMFHSHVSHVSWSCCIVLTNLVSLSEWHMLHLSVAHFTFHKRTTHMKYTTRWNVSNLCFMCYKFTKRCMMLMFMKCSANVKAKHQGCYRHSGLKNKHHTKLCWRYVHIISRYH